MKKGILLLLLLFFIKVDFTNAQNEKFKALFLYNFTKYIDWPASYKQGDFVIGVLGNSPIVNELKIVSSKKQVGGQSIVVKKFANPAQIDKCHVLFIPSYKSGSLRAVLANLKEKNTLVVTDGNNLVQQGAGINFIETSGKQGFEIKKHNIESKGLKVSGSLLSLGTVVN